MDVTEKHMSYGVVYKQLVRGKTHIQRWVKRRNDTGCFNS